MIEVGKILFLIKFDDLVIFPIHLSFSQKYYGFRCYRITFINFGVYMVYIMTLMLTCMPLRFLNAKAKQAQVLVYIYMVHFEIQYKLRKCCSGLVKYVCLQRFLSSGVTELLKMCDRAYVICQYNGMPSFIYLYFNLHLYIENRLVLLFPRCPNILQYFYAMTRMLLLFLFIFDRLPRL